jgi:Ca2+/Na+ antiporter
MSFADRLVLWLHIGFAIFTIGPVTVAIMSTPRYIRQRNLVIVRYLYRITRIFAIFSLGVLIAGLVLARLLDDYSKPWLTVSLTLFVVSLVLLVLIVRDQHRAITALEDAQAPADLGAGAPEAASHAGAEPAGAAAGDPGPARLPGGPADASAPSGHVERGRIASLGGVVALIWLVVLVLMVWNG